MLCPCAYHQSLHKPNTSSQSAASLRAKDFHSRPASSAAWIMYSIIATDKRRTGRTYRFNWRLSLSSCSSSDAVSHVKQGALGDLSYESEAAEHLRGELRAAAAQHRQLQAAAEEAEGRASAAHQVNFDSPPVALAFRLRSVKFVLLLYSSPIHPAACIVSSSTRLWLGSS